jgi:type IV pilus assembly protein PilC
MANANGVRRYVAEVSRRLLALRAESINPQKAVQILVAEKILPPQTSADPEFPLSSAIRSIIPRPENSSSLASVAAYVQACESQGRGDAALQLLGRLKIRRAHGRTSLGVIGVEFALLMLVLMIHSLFVLPQIQAMFDSVATPMPPFTRLVFALIGPSGPFLYAAAIVLLLVMAWRLLPAIFGPLLRPIDRLLLMLPLVGPSIRQSNSDRMSGWLGFASADTSTQSSAIDAARAWYRGDLLSRECAEVLKSVQSGKGVSSCLIEARGFDSEFKALLAMTEREDSLAALRARWRIAETLPEQNSALAPALTQVVLGVLVGAVVIAMYLPIFKLGSVLWTN